jgi:hypothetical protein
VIAFATRLLVLLLALSTTGVLPAVGRLADARCAQGDAGPHHADGDQGCCNDECSPNCAVCICCPLRATPTTRVTQVMPIELHPQAVAFARTSRVLPGITTEIFHPPRV